MKRIGDCLFRLIKIYERELPAGLVEPNELKLYCSLRIGKPEISYKRIPFRPFPDIEWK